MRFRPFHSWGWLLTAVLALVLVACESAEKKKPSVTPPIAAQAPTVELSSAPPPKVEEEAVPKPDPLEVLIGQVEKEYQAGRADYKAGHLESAKQKFDHAFDLLADSPFDVRGNDRLQQEFDKLIEEVHNLELLALQQGDGFTEQKSEPAPIDEANETTFPVDPSIKARAEQEVGSIHSDLPLMINDAVASYISYFSSKGRSTIEHGLVRSGRYRDMISRILREEGVPQDLIYLAQAESGFRPLALSRAGARGMWQFMASRGSEYGLQRNWWVDERQDPEKATRAAARHLKDLYDMFGDWYLAMAAYNSGPGTVASAVQRTGYADYWELYERRVLPAETRNYVPIILAVTIMAKNPKQYGLETLVPEEPLETDHVTINYPVDLRLVAECVDTTVETIQDLNPGLLRMTTPKDKEFDLRLPAGTRDKYMAAIQAIPPDMRVWWRYHRVQAGDSLEAVARRYRTTVAAITEVNGVEDDVPLPLDAKLVIPVTPGKRIEGEVQYSRRATRYRVRRGDTILSVADDFGVPVNVLRKWNRLSGSKLRPGRVLIIHRPVAGSEATLVSRTKAEPTRSLKSSAVSKSSKTNMLHGSRKVAARHRVKKGETLSGIASAYRTNVAQLRRLNRNIPPNQLRPGMMLVIPETDD